MLSKPFIACNIYISAGRPRYAPFLLQLLKDAQQTAQLHSLNQQQVIVVHAFSDTSYDRSSFHIAGTPVAVASVASKIASQALTQLPSQKEQQSSNHHDLDHPQVGLVDHISVLPLAEHNSHPLITLEEWQKETTPQLSPKSSNMPASSLPSGWVARTIGDQLESLVNVLWYGHADSEGRTLAVVRRESTNFFRSSSSATIQQHSFCTIGATSEFVENYNIRLSSGLDKKTAQSLTRWVRERDGGLRFVEALTLPYSENRFEVACNLLNPKVTSTCAIDARIEEYLVGNPEKLKVETSYRVGTTEGQCLQALEAIKSGRKKSQDYDEQVMKQFASYFQ